MLSHYGVETGLKIARKHLGWYSKGLPGSAEFRTRVNQIDEPQAVMALVRDFYQPQIEQMAA
jgi:tRNA-dihydrouridine synthase B